MSERHGSLSINSDNIFPIIKKWLYSDHDIFFRELISNGCDAITKLKKLDMMGEYTLPEKYKAQVQVLVNPDEKTLKFIDNGLGMTADEVEEYINQIAFSGATDFLAQYKDKTNEDQKIDLYSKDINYNIIVDNTRKTKQMLTILQDDLYTYNKTIAASSREETVLLYTVSDSVANNMKDLKLQIQYGGASAVIQLDQ